MHESPIICVPHTYLTVLVLAQWHKPIMAHELRIVSVMGFTTSFVDIRVVHVFCVVLDYLQQCSGTECWPMFFCGRTMVLRAAIKNR